jgi:hypothetical protein
MNEFIKQVDKIVIGQLGFSVHDMEDFAFCDYYNENFDPDGYEFSNAVEECANDFLDRVQEGFTAF